jgi:hypothetical protein
MNLVSAEGSDYLLQETYECVTLGWFLCGIVRDVNRQLAGALSCCRPLD